LTPPSGAQLPSERIDACARRELEEETGLEQAPELTSHGTDDWSVYEVHPGPVDAIRLSVEHDRCMWVPVEQAILLCEPERVAALFVQVQRGA
jgi:8-oxo-dGTP pyrophosphatase MutT (NUDIX family)